MAMDSLRGALFFGRLMQIEGKSREEQAEILAEMFVEVFLNIIHGVAKETLVGIFKQALLEDQEALETWIERAKEIREYVFEEAQRKDREGEYGENDLRTNDSN